MEELTGEIVFCRLIPDARERYKKKDNGIYRYQDTEYAVTKCISQTVTIKSPLGVSVLGIDRSVQLVVSPLRQQLQSCKPYTAGSRSGDGRAREHPELLQEPKELKYILDYIRNKRRSADVPMEVTYGCLHFLTTEYEREVRDYYFICGSSGWHESGVGVI